MDILEKDQNNFKSVFIQKFKMKLKRYEKCHLAKMMQ